MSVRASHKRRDKKPCEREGRSSLTIRGNHPEKLAMVWTTREGSVNFLSVRATTRGELDNAKLGLDPCTSRKLHTQGQG